MQKSKKTAIQMETNRVNGYHHGSFQKNLYFTSDRKEELDTVTFDGFDHYPKFIRKNGTAVKGYGLEIETSCYGLADQYANENSYVTLLKNLCFSKLPDDLFKIESDITLGGNVNAECITQLMTKEFIRNNYRNWKYMWDNFNLFGIRPDDGNCGMHCNISLACFGGTKSAQDLAIRKLFYFVNHHYDFCCELFYRNRSHTNWCGRMYYENAKTMDLNNMDGDHGNCMNYSHYAQGRIEIRLVGGQKNFASFRNTMECIFHLVDAVKVCSWDDLNDLVKVFSGCNKYVFDRISSKCFENGTISLDKVNQIRQTVNTEIVYL